MPLDSCFLSGLTLELSERITGARIDKVQQPERDLLILSLRMPSGNGKLLINGGVGSARIHLTQGQFENPPSPPMFCMILRKHLTGARIRSITQPDFERLVYLDLDARDEMGLPVFRRLIVEMMGRQSNVILTDGDEIIIDCMRRVDSAMSTVRPLLPGMRYRFPAKQDRPSLPETGPEERRRILQHAVSGETLDDRLLHAFSGLSPLICRELCYRALGDASPQIPALTSEQIEALLSETEMLVSCIRDRRYSPVLLMKDGKAKDFSFLPICQYQSAMICEARGGFSELLDEYYLRRDHAESMRHKAQSLIRTVKGQRDRAVKKLALQQEELQRSTDRDMLRRRADLIMSNLYQICKGDRVLKAVDYYDPEQPTVEIALDPLKTPQQNAAALYKQYQKAKTAEVHLTALIADGERNIQYLNSVLEELSRAESEQDLAAIRSELRETGFLRQEKGQKKGKLRPRAPLTFVSDAGLEILVGRSNQQNDELTHRIARRTDYWLHVQRIHGSHVIIRANDAIPDDFTIAQAASLAVYYSQARDSGKTPVDYTMVRNVRRPSGALPGMVLYTTYQTVLAEADESLVHRLLKSR